MRSARLALALDTGALSLPETGDIAIFAPVAGDDLTALPRDRLRLVQGFWPDHQAFARAGYSVSTDPEGPYTAVLVCVPRAKDAARAMIAEAAARVVPGGLVLVDGQKTDGIDSLLRECRAKVGIGSEVSAPVAKAHGKLFWFRADPGRFTDWAAIAAPLPVGAGLQTVPGVFSADGIDPGSAALVAALPAKLGNRVADLGAGWGYLAGEVLKRDGVKEVHLVEADHAALTLARANLGDPRARFHWADATNIKLGSKMDTVVMNPPFHLWRAADPGLGAAFIRAAGALLTPGGVLWMVANRHLPYERVLAETFRDVELLPGSGAYKVYRAARPVAAAHGAVEAGRAKKSGRVEKSGRAEKSGRVEKSGRAEKSGGQSVVRTRR